jgi:ribose transport system ATP-binding protein
VSENHRSQALPVVLDVCSVSRVYGATTALDSAALRMYAGEIHGLLGENGAGKSTLVRILAGLERRDGGDVEMLGDVLPLHPTPHEIAARGIAFIHQDLGLVGDMSVLDNVAFMTGYPRRMGFIIDYGAAERQTRDALRRLNFPLDDVHTSVGSLPLASRAVVALARALVTNARIIVLDEPTAALQAAEATVLFQTLRALTTDGVACLLISHRMDEIMRVCDRVTVFRNGRDVGTARVDETTQSELVSMIVGSATAPAPPTDALVTTASDDRGPAIVLDQAASEFMAPLDITIPSGQITAVTGLAGSGHLAVARLICGAERLHSGAMYFHGMPFAPRDVAAALRAGISCVPPDRVEDGVVPALNLLENLYLNPATPWWRPLVGSVERARGRSDLIRSLVEPPDPDREITTLSGGNQQKLLIGRALAHDPTVLVLAEPTAGVDVGAKRQIQAMISEVCRRTGMAVVLASSDYEEVADMADRAIVLVDGQVVGELTRPTMTSASIAEMSYGIRKAS